jgi:2'-5' RNA ligase
MALVRAFVAIHLPPEVLRALAAVQDRLRAMPGGEAGRWVPAENMHLTIKFVGDVLPERLTALHLALQRACAGQSPFALPVGGLGCFPNAQRPRVVWAGVQDAPGRLDGLVAALEREAAAAGFPREQRAFAPHLTLARVADWASHEQVLALGQSVARAQVGLLGEIVVQRVAIMRSDLRPQGPQYTQLFSVPLAASSVTGADR